MAKKVLLAMSGGVDSTVAAFLLKEQGYEVLGCTLNTWVSPTCENKNTRACCGTKGIEDARQSADILGIEHIVLDVADEFEKLVVQNFKTEYLAGRTPNPCIKCNEHIKFSLPYKIAQDRGIDFIATGHYARLTKNANGNTELRQGLDPGKDQSYVLFCLPQEMLNRTLLPIGDLQKSKVREIAREQNLPVFDKPDSQEICFIPSHDYPKFLEKEFQITARQGAIRDTSGKVLGIHDGYFRYTVGQRRGIGVAHPKPLYVLQLKPLENEVVVGSREEIYTQPFMVRKINWLSEMPKQGEFEAEVKIRSVHPKARAILRWQGDVIVGQFFEAQESITPGQAAVFYDGDRVLGGGWIDLSTPTPKGVVAQDSAPLELR